MERGADRKLSSTRASGALAASPHYPSILHPKQVLWQRRRPRPLLSAGFPHVSGVEHELPLILPSEPTESEGGGGGAGIR